MSAWVFIQRHADEHITREWYGILNAEAQVELLAQVNSGGWVWLRELTNPPHISAFEGVDLFRDSIERRHLLDWDDPEIRLKLEKTVENLANLLATVRAGGMKI